MQQSIDLTADFFQISHSFIPKLYADTSLPDLWTSLTLAGFDLLFSIQGPTSWMHEEHHRAVLSRRGISSTNQMGFLPFLPGYAYNGQVDHVSDEDLSKLKAEHPAEMVQMHIAGINSQILLDRTLTDRSFFGQTHTNDLYLRWISQMVNLLYMYGCSSGQKIAEKEQTTVASRDFTGLDCLAWVYDMFRPTEPYSGRGVHVTGVGVDRYIKREELTSEEKSYLDTTTWLYLLNFINPQLYGVDRIRLGQMDFNFALRTYMAPFGRLIETDLMFANSSSIPDIVLRLYSVSNKSNFSFIAGSELQLVRYPLRIGDNETLYLTPTVMIAHQPKDLSFYTDMEWMGMVGLKASYPVLKWAEVFGEARYKTKGWVPDMLYLNSQVTFRAGAVFKF